MFKTVRMINSFKNYLNSKNCHIGTIGRAPIIIGLQVTTILLGTFIIWGLFFKIDSTVIAAGKIILDDDKKKIQHLEGGVIEEILVSEGQKVYKGQTLIRLSITNAKTSQDLLREQLIALKATKIRLEVERDGKSILDFSNLNNRFEKNEDINKILQSERELFVTRKKVIDEKVAILHQKIHQLSNQILALKSQHRAVSERIDLSKDELESLQKLYDENIISKTRYLEIKKQIAELSGNQGEYFANISKTKQAIAETDLEIINLNTQNNNDVIKELRETQSKIVDLSEKIHVAQDILNRTVIVAPQSGIVTGLKFHTKGGVIAPAAEVMDLIPQDDELIVEVKINPSDIDVVMNGLEARIRLTAYRSKIVPMLKGSVINVSADSFVEAGSNVAYFLARIRITDSELKTLADNVHLYPGMPVEAYIVTGSRTFFTYLFDPIIISTRKAFREE